MTTIGRPAATAKHSDPARTTPLGMLRYAIEFYAAGMATDDALGHEKGYEITAPIPVNYLLGHAIELGFKAYLLQQDTDLGYLKNGLGHDLAACYVAAEKAGLSQHFKPAPEDGNVLHVLNALYSTKQFEYIETGMKEFPVFGPLQMFAKRLLLAVAATVPKGELLLRSKAGEVLKK